MSFPGETPDLEDSPEVLSWMWMFRGGGGVVESAGTGRRERPRDSWEAFFWESIEETRWRLGIVEARGLHLSVGGISLKIVNRLSAWKFLQGL